MNRENGKSIEKDQKNLDQPKKFLIVQAELRLENYP